MRKYVPLDVHARQFTPRLRLLVKDKDAIEECDVAVLAAAGKRGVRRVEGGQAGPA